MKYFLFLWGIFLFSAEMYCQVKKTTAGSSLNKKDDIIATKDFEKHKGFLLLPVDEYISFETVDNESLKCLQLPGITIVCKKNTPIKIIISCKVAGIAKIGTTHAIILRSGSYFITYSNLKDISVKKGDILREGDIVGNADVGIDDTDQKYQIEIILSTSKDKYLSPSKWFKFPTQAITETDK